MEAELATAKIACLLRKARLPPSNLSEAEVSAISELKRNENIVIASADKGNATVTMDREDDRRKACDILLLLYNRRKQIMQGRYNTKHFLALTPAGAESDLNASTNGAEPDGSHRS